MLNQIIGLIIRIGKTHKWLKSPRITAAVLVACMMFTLMPVTASAAETDSGASHTHMQDCYELSCSHENGGHDEDCGYSAETVGADCTYECELCKVQDSDPIAPAPALCSCTEKCTAADEANNIEDKINPDCPVCSAENADLAAACMGEEPKPVSQLLLRATGDVTPAQKLANDLNDIKANTATVDGTTVTLLQDIDLDDTITIVGGDITLDLKTFTITGKAGASNSNGNNTANNNGGFGGIGIKVTGGSLTITGGEISGGGGSSSLCGIGSSLVNYSLSSRALTNDNLCIMKNPANIAGFFVARSS